MKYLKMSLLIVLVVVGLVVISLGVYTLISVYQHTARQAQIEACARE